MATDPAAMTIAKRHMISMFFEFGFIRILETQQDNQKLSRRKNWICRSSKSRPRFCVDVIVL